jgi:glutamate-5-semialdehyde dehydrogenase
VTDQLAALHDGQAIPYGGDRFTRVSADLASAFRPGDRLVVVQETGDLLHIPSAQHDLVSREVQRASEAFHQLADCTDEQITTFFDRFAGRLADDEVFAAIADANAGDVADAERRGRSTTRLELTPAMRAGMIAGLHVWRDAPSPRSVVTGEIAHEGWALERRTAPLGVVGFVFEGRPNVFADAVGVVRTGNTVVFRIGSDALTTAVAIMEHALEPALAAAGLPAGTVALVASVERSAGWALFSNRSVALAVARGSGPAVAQLGAVARQAGVPVSLHGTGGAWMVVDDTADATRLRASVVHSLDRKVCNTLNVCCLPRSRATELVAVFIDAVREAADQLGTSARIHVESSTVPLIDPELMGCEVVVERSSGPRTEPFVSTIAREALGTEWEWERSPEVTLVVVDDVDEAVELFNRYSPRFIASLVSERREAHERFFERVDAPFVGDGFTRWVDGHYALDTPELGLSNWEGGRLLARGAILAGDTVHTVRYRARIDDAGLRR